MRETIRASASNTISIVRDWHSTFIPCGTTETGSSSLVRLRTKTMLLPTKLFTKRLYTNPKNGLTKKNGAAYFMQSQSCPADHAAEKNSAAVWARSSSMVFR